MTRATRSRTLPELSAAQLQAYEAFTQATRGLDAAKVAKALTKQLPTMTWNVSKPTLAGCYARDTAPMNGTRLYGSLHKIDLARLRKDAGGR